MNRPEGHHGQPSGSSPPWPSSSSKGRTDVGHQPPPSSSSAALDGHPHPTGRSYVSTPTSSPARRRRRCAQVGHTSPSNAVPHSSQTASPRSDVDDPAPHPDEPRPTGRRRCCSSARRVVHVCLPSRGWTAPGRTVWTPGRPGARTCRRRSGGAFEVERSPAPAAAPPSSQYRSDGSIPIARRPSWRAATSVVPGSREGVEHRLARPGRQPDAPPRQLHRERRRVPARRDAQGAGSTPSSTTPANHPRRRAQSSTASGGATLPLPRAGHQDRLPVTPQVRRRRRLPRPPRRPRTPRRTPRHLIDQRQPEHIEHRRPPVREHHPPLPRCSRVRSRGTSGTDTAVLTHARPPRPSTPATMAAASSASSQ